MSATRCLVSGGATFGSGGGALMLAEGSEAVGSDIAGVGLGLFSVDQIWAAERRALALLRSGAACCGTGCC
jgi:hypothetical protein